MSGTADRGRSQLAKSRTGITGLDEITGGGLPTGRATLVCGGAGCGKTLLALEFLVRGATELGEPGVFLAFEETAEELAQNVSSLGFDLEELVAQRKLLVDHVRVDRSEIEETGDYDLEALFIRLGSAIDEIGAKRVAIDTIETLFGGLANAAILRSELRRLFRWLKDRGVTTVITGERGEGQLTRQGLEEYVSDCVILLDHRVTDQLSTRRLRVVKYRGSVHGTNEFPFLIDEDGISVLPITSSLLVHDAGTERISSGIPRLDAMLGGPGYYRGSSILASGTAGAGKTSFAAHLAEAACRRGERCAFFSFEESERQLVRNMRTIGIELQPWIDEGLLVVHASRPSLHGLEAHLVAIHKHVKALAPSVVVIDPMSNFSSAGVRSEAHSMLVRLVDHLKSAGITAFLTSLTEGGQALERTNDGISSLVDTWLLLRDVEEGAERRRVLCVLKSRGMAHSHQVREFRLTSHGVDVLDASVAPVALATLAGPGQARELSRLAGERQGEHTS
ncbi:MAG TPA: circadian clock protein KaiC [Planctomycetota bacterium]|nr:circadian clock protein KaiC [Planctomycetota bacterium]